MTVWVITNDGIAVGVYNSRSDAEASIKLTWPDTVFQEWGKHSILYTYAQGWGRIQEVALSNAPNKLIRG